MQNGIGKTGRLERGVGIVFGHGSKYTAEGPFEFSVVIGPFRSGDGYVAKNAPKQDTKFEQEIEFIVDRRCYKNS